MGIKRDDHATLTMSLLLFLLLYTPACALVPYWKDPRIHNMGNVGLRGGVHAVLAPVATRIIDRVAYGGEDVRETVLAAHVAPL